MSLQKIPNLQERIRMIAFRMIEKQYKSVKSPSPDEYVTNPELSTVLLLLPCFVASYLDLCCERGATRAKKEKYMMWIHRVIYSYEKTPVVQKQFQMYENLTLSHHEKSSMKTLFREWVVKLNQCLRVLLDRSRIRHEIAVKCMHYLASCDADQESQGGNSHWLQIDYVWYSHLLMFWDRIFESLLDSGLMTMKLDEIQYSNFKYLWSEYAHTLDSLRMHITDHIEFRTGAFTMPDKKKGLELEELVLHKVPPALRNAAKKLSVQQLIGLIIYLFMKDFTNQNTKFDGRQIFPVNDYGKLIGALIANDRWKVKLLMASERNKSEDFSLVTYQQAKNNLYYKEVMRSVTPSGKVTMKSPGEITFCPIKHCRWCGQAEVKKFRVCPECKDNLDYPDLNFFCSETCEKQCLEKQHIEEHANYLMMQIGIVK
jgi:hypothetical protein